MIHDFGPIYTETNIERFPVEPFNTFSNLIFLWLCIYWYRKIKNGWDTPGAKMMKWGLPILFIGYAGGTIYHATRSHSLWLILDFMPIMILVIMASVFFWKRVFKETWKIVLSVVLLIAIPRILLLKFFNTSSLTISLGYLSMSFPIIAPIIIYEYRHGWRDMLWAGVAAMTLAVAVTFRLSDNQPWVVEVFPMGTHWLWHLFGGLTSHIIISYLYLSEKRLYT